jgi:hypothetical protein
VLQRGKPAALHSTRPLAALQGCPAPLPASAQHAGPSSAARGADISRSDRTLQTLQLDDTAAINSLFGWLVADGWCWFVLREEYCWLVLAGCWWLVSSERKVLLAGG